MCRPCRGFSAVGGTFSHPDRVGVGYDLPSFRDFSLPVFGNLKFEIQNLKSKDETKTRKT